MGLVLKVAHLRRMVYLPQHECLRFFMRSTILKGKHKERNLKLMKTFTNPVPEKMITYDDIDNLKYTDVLIIGGGAMGSSVAYWLKEKAGKEISVLVAERDKSYCTSSTCLSVGGVRQQFSLSENIQLSLFGAEFLQNIGDYLAVDNKPLPDVQFQPHGYLYLASNRGVETLKQNSELQCKLGANNLLLSPAKLKERFSWINTEGVALGCLGVENEGWFDPWSLLNALRDKSIHIGANFIDAEVIAFNCSEDSDTDDAKNKKLSEAVVRLANGSFVIVKFKYCVITGGANSSIIAKAANDCFSDDPLLVPLPIEPRKRYVYCYHCPEGPGKDTPLVIDPSGAYFRREGLGGNFIAGMSPSPENEPSICNLDVDYDFYNEVVWPIIANRVPAFQKSKLQSAWAGYYEYNSLDENGVIGPHPLISNLFFACGFSGHGIQHSPATGRAISELILEGSYKTIDLTRLGFQRICSGQPIIEKNIV